MIMGVDAPSDCRRRALAASGCAAATYRRADSGLPWPTPPAVGKLSVNQPLKATQACDPASRTETHLQASCWKPML